VQKAIVSLSEIFTIPTAQLDQKLKTYYIANWVTDPYCQGGYAYETVNANHYRQILKEPVDNTLFFAGEALHNGPEIGTVEAALCSGKEAVAKLLAHL
jgi:monoamine oxidase